MFRHFGMAQGQTQNASSLASPGALPDGIKHRTFFSRSDLSSTSCVQRHTNHTLRSDPHIFSKTSTCRYFNLSSNHLLPSIAHVFCSIKLPRISMHTFNAGDWPSLRFIIDGLYERLDHSEQKAIFLLPFSRWKASRCPEQPIRASFDTFVPMSLSSRTVRRDQNLRKAFIPLH